MLVSSQKQHKSFSKNEIFNLDGIWIIKSGYLYTRCITSTGDYQILGLLSTGDILTDVANFNTSEHKALSDVVVEKADIRDINRELLATYSRAQQLLQLRGTRIVKDRVHEFLKWLAQNFHTNHDSKQIAFRLTQEEIAKTLNTTRVTVTRSLQDLQEESLINLSRYPKGIIVN